MKIKVKFVSFSGELSGVDETELCLPQGATIKDVLEKVTDDFPKLKKWLPQYISHIPQKNIADFGSTPH